MSQIFTSRILGIRAYGVYFCCIPFVYPNKVSQPLLTIYLTAKGREIEHKMVEISTCMVRSWVSSATLLIAYIQISSGPTDADLCWDVRKPRV